MEASCDSSEGPGRDTEIRPGLRVFKMEQQSLDCSLVSLYFCFETILLVMKISD